MNKIYKINYINQSAGRMVLKLKLSVCDQVNNLISHISSFFIRENASLWHGTDFYHVFGNNHNIANLSTEQIPYIAHSIHSKSYDASYNAKISIINNIISKLQTLTKSLDFLNYEYRINTIQDIYNLRNNCILGNVPNSLRQTIQIYENAADDPNGPFPLNNYYNPSTPPNVPNTTNYRCVYRDKTCLGEKDVITLDLIDHNKLKNVAKVDDRCYDADELQKWLVNNPTVPHNRKSFTSKELNDCVDGIKPFTPPSPISNTQLNPLSNLSYNPTSPSLYSASPSTIFVAPVQNSPINYSISKKKVDYDWIDDDDDDDDLFKDKSESNFISSYNNIPKKKTSKKGSKKKTSKKGSKKKNSKKGSKKKNSKKGSKKKNSKK